MTRKLLNSHQTLFLVRGGLWSQDSPECAGFFCMCVYAFDKVDLFLCFPEMRGGWTHVMCVGWMLMVDYTTTEEGPIRSKVPWNLLCYELGQPTSFWLQYGAVADRVLQCATNTTFAHQTNSKGNASLGSMCLRKVPRNQSWDVVAWQLTDYC